MLSYQEGSVFMVRDTGLIVIKGLSDYSSLILLPLLDVL